MGEASFTAAPPVFNGENYQTWAVRMTVHLQALDVWEAIEEDYEISPLGANPTVAQMKNHKEKKTRKAKAKACLFSAVSPLILTRIMQLESAAEIWKHLREEYQGNERVRNMQVMNLIREFEMVRMKESQTIKDYAEQLLTIANKVRLLGKEFSDERVVQKIFVTLPEKYEATISSLENTKDLSSITLAELLNALQALEQRRLMRQGSSVEGAFQAKTQTNEGNTRRRKNSNNNNQKTGTYPPCPHCKKTNHPQQKCWWRPDVKCNKCGRQGHIERICRTQQQQGETNVAAEQYQEEQLFSATCFANGSTSESWLVDSGCTNHMTYDQDLFREIDRTTISKVRIGNGEYIPVKGKGTVAIESLTGLKLISDVLQNCIIKDEGKEMSKLSAQHENNTMLWHKRLGHFHHNVLYMKKNQIVEGLRFGRRTSYMCSCQYGKQTRLHFPQKQMEINTKLQLVKRDKLDKSQNQEFSLDTTAPQKLTESTCHKIVKLCESKYIDEDVERINNILMKMLMNFQLEVSDTFDIYQRCNIVVLEPAGFVEAAENKSWRVAMQEELNMIDKNNTWELVDRPSHKKPIGVKWVYRTKLNSDGSINKHKARLVVKGYAQMFGVDFSETFAPVARLDTIRMLLALAAQRKWKIYQLDVKSAFLNGYLEEEIFVEQPEGFAIKGKEEKVYLLKKALYGLRQALEHRIDTHLLTLGFHKSLSEFTLYIKKIEEDILIVSLYVDDLLVTGSNAGFVNKFKAEMEQVFEMTDLGEMSYFLGMEVHQKQNEIFICQQKYAKEILKKFKMEECKPTSTPMNQKEKFCKEDGAEKVDEGLYRSMIGCLMYLTATRPDIMHAVSLLSRYMHCASEIHFQAAKRVIRYVKGTVDYGIKFSQVQSFNFHGFSDSDWAGCVDDMRSTSGYCFSFGSGVFSWSSRKQEVVAQSTAEAEYIAAVAAVNQALWLRKLLTDLDMKQEVSTKVFVDNQATISIANDPVFHDLSFYEKDLEFAAPKSRRSVESYALVAAEGKAEIVNHMNAEAIFMFLFLLLLFLFLHHCLDSHGKN
ncbi:hypothetical protein AAG906_028353 [Vitis piasezkii]